MKMLLFIILLSFSTLTFALEIDEKLTLRIVNTSVSKKTILINRGIEDGLKQSDHAKFYVSEGVVARAVCIKLSPTRSVWSIYRVVASDFIKDDQVMKLKITPPVKITKDDSRMLVKEDIGAFVSKDPRDLGIPLADGAEDLGDTLGLTRKDLDMMETITSLRNKNREVFGMVYYSSDAVESTGSNNNTKFTSTEDNLSLKIGGEYYFRDETKWYSRISILGSFSLNRSSIMAYQGATVQENSSEFGFGGNFYLFERPSSVHKLIYSVGYIFALGSANSTYTPGKEDLNGESLSLDASTLSHTFSAAAKYYTTYGFGVRAEFLYRLHGEEFSADESATKYTRTKVGPKLLLGLGYRF